MMAEQASMSPRNFARLFVGEYGITPGKYVETLRVEEARRRLEDCKQPIEKIAVDCGFRNSTRMRRSFKRALHVVPEHYRRAFGSA
jgi:transcriptional regulator GlxA family with amidase domain